MPKMKIHKEFKFDSAHWLPHVPPTHKCANMHGHTYYIEVHCEDELDPKFGWVIDFNDVRKVVDPLIDQLDHKVLNEIEGLENPTSENLAKWIWQQLQPGLAGLSKIVVQETCNAGCIYYGE